MNKKYLVTFLVMAMFLMVSGCSKSVERVGIEGVVTYEGKPLVGAMVTIKPIAGPGAGAETDADGKYVITKGAGPMQGECQIIVEKYAPVPTGTNGEEAYEPVLPPNIHGIPKQFVLNRGVNKIDIDLDKW
ncbi:MAG: carboxypeptidase-like regulatory domain-containing protein [Planctomycetaceae bacterium]|jgi:hypothetical protein|nr:carboxypeptidase-like regulatory domain-containing protein [Planctomycetaceae bacterium]